MPKATFTIRPVVCVTIMGKKSRIKGVNMPHVRNDGGLVHKFFEFQLGQNIYPAIRGGMSGGGMYVGFFTAEDAKKIEAWLLEQGAERDE